MNDTDAPEADHATVNGVVLRDHSLVDLGLNDAPAETVTGCEADELEVGSVVIDPVAPAPLPIVKRPDGWASSLYLDVHRLARRHRYVVIRRAPAPTEAQLEAIASETTPKSDNAPEGGAA